ncbi:MAG TPA: polysaccharide deacetylase family protein, partial [Thermoanaerobaculia bacterium]|nr:polysaccharide deacetylase family protein [Thermoanaerobaculia bacterium]
MPDPVPAPPREGSEPAPGRPARPYRIPSFLRATLAIHAGGLATLLAVPERWPWVAGALVLDHLAIGGACLTPQSRLLGPNVSRLGAEETARGEIGLTFDDGPDPEVTPRVLDLLAERGAQASFFAIGKRVREHPEIAAEIARRGHRVENHTLHHRYDFSLRGVRPLEREIAGAQE